MIIVDQGKTKLINFENLIQIYITRDEEDLYYYIRCETVEGLYEDLGGYSTEERAKEVLQGITNAYEKAGNIKFETSDDERLMRLVHNSSVFEMPEK